MTTRVAARDEVLSLVKGVGDINGVLLIWDDTRSQEPQGPGDLGANVAWARVLLEHLTGRQATLANHNGVRRWGRTGLLTIQLFTPQGDGNELADQLVPLFETILEGHSGSVWIRDVTSAEARQSGVWAQTNITATFEYDEVR